MTYFKKANYSSSLHDWLRRGRKWDIECGRFLSLPKWVIID
jgi:hypothetical protein